MTLPSSGPMSASMINVELGRAADAPFNINGTAERTLAQKPSGTISFSDFYGKSSSTPPTLRGPAAFGNQGGNSSFVPLASNVAGDIMIIFLWGFGASPGYVTPAGWTPIIGENYTAAAYWRVSPGGLGSVTVGHISNQSLATVSASVSVLPTDVYTPVTFNAVLGASGNYAAVSVAGAPSILNTAFAADTTVSPVFPLPNFQGTGAPESFLGYMPHFCCGGFSGATAPAGVFGVDGVISVALRGK